MIAERTRLRQLCNEARKELNEARKELEAARVSESELADAVASRDGAREELDAIRKGAKGLTEALIPWAEWKHDAGTTNRP